MKRIMLTAIAPVVLLVTLLCTNTLTLEKNQTDNILISDITSETSTSIQQAEGNSPDTVKSMLSFAHDLLGTPYVYAGMSPEGFDCSGFTAYVYDQFGISIPHSSALQTDSGSSIPKYKAKAGDLIIFTGTNASIRKPGHVGIIVSTSDDTTKFIHSSSNGGVKVSNVEGTNYSKRFLEVRRVM
jgi:cell wall-associated NlpC family hydrolase